MKTILISLLIILFPVLIPEVSAQKSALVLIDIQDFYFPGGALPLENPEAAGINAGLLLQDFRSRGELVVHVRHEFEPGGSIHDFVSPVEGETVFSKKDVNAFLNTGLKDYLDENNVSQLVICGMQTHMCVEAAVRAAHDYGYEVVLVRDACATRALQYDDKIVTAENVHLSTLKTLSGNYCRIVTTDEWLTRNEVIGKSD